MNRFRRRRITRVMVLILCLLLPALPLPPDVPTSTAKQETADAREDTRLESIFHWGKKHFLDGKYREAAGMLDLLLSYLDDGDRRLEGKTRMLLGAANEKLGRIVAARKQYKIARAMNTPPGVEGLDFSYLVEYQRIIMDNTKPMMERVIEREAHRPKKKQVSPWMTVLGLTVVAAITAFIVINKKNNSRDDYPVTPVNPDFDVEELGIQWVEVDGGEFQMGDNFGEGDKDELPVHTVELSRYRISRDEITFEQYGKYLLAKPGGGSLPPDEGWGRGRRPVINVTWGEADAFCKWLSTQTGKMIRLPTEAQWEFAARGKDQRRHPWGDIPPNCSLANYCCNHRTEPVGSYPAGSTILGIHDMAGNVAEWCRDFYDPNYYGISLIQDPEGPAGGTHKVIRGGSWNCTLPLSARCADRHNLPHGGQLYAASDLGFRIVWENLD